MIYKFKSKASGDLIMLGPNGDAMLRILGREPQPKGIIEPAAMAGAIVAIEKALAQAKAVQKAADASQAVSSSSGVSLQQRLWPMLEMLRRAQAAAQPIVWGV